MRNLPSHIKSFIRDHLVDKFFISKCDKSPPKISAYPGSSTLVVKAVVPSLFSNVQRITIQGHR